MDAEERLEAAQQALQALDDEQHVAIEFGYGPVEREQYRARHWKQLREALGVAMPSQDEEFGY